MSDLRANQRPMKSLYAFPPLLHSIGPSAEGPHAQPSRFRIVDRVTDQPRKVRTLRAPAVDREEGARWYESTKDSLRQRRNRRHGDLAARAPSRHQEHKPSHVDRLSFAGSIASSLPLIEEPQTQEDLRAPRVATKIWARVDPPGRSMSLTNETVSHDLIQGYLRHPTPTRPPSALCFVPGKAAGSNEATRLPATLSDQVLASSRELSSVSIPTRVFPKAFFTRW